MLGREALRKRMSAEKAKNNNGSPEQLISSALGAGRTMLNEHEAKLLLAAFGAPIVEEWLCADAESAAERAADAAPVAVKLCSPEVAHKKEGGFVVLGLSTRDEVLAAARDMLTRASERGVVVDGILVQRMARGERELLAGMKRDPVFGPCVTLGLGGIFTEALNDVSVRVAPLAESDAADMLGELKSKHIFGNYRGLKQIDTAAIAKLLGGLGEIGLRHAEIREIDVNPVIVDENGNAIAVDALVLLNGNGEFNK
jgi:acetate---CoA ligase (ADP-forming) subunit beta